jgi:eukaryotic-like serine/threonine-protein kinase
MGRFVNQTLSALQYLHTHAQMAHRDIKPDNILFDYVGGEKALTFYIGDFGLAASQETIIQHGFAGSIPYMAPELTRRGCAEPKSDIWSFGVMMLEILEYCCIAEGWRTQFSEHSWREKLRAYGAHGTSHYADEPPYPGDRTPEMRVAHSRIKSLSTYNIIEGALTRMLHEDVRRRPSAEEARTDLLRYNWANRRRSSPPVRATPTPAPAPAPAPPPLRRKHTQEPPAPLRRRQTQDQRLPPQWGHPLSPDEKLKRRITGGFRHVVAR